MCGDSSSSDSSSSMSDADATAALGDMDSSSQSNQSGPQDLGGGWSYSPATDNQSANYGYGATTGPSSLGGGTGPTSGGGVVDTFDTSGKSDRSGMPDGWDVNTPDETNFSSGSLGVQGAGLAGSLGELAGQAISGYDFSHDSGLPGWYDENAITYGYGPLGAVQGFVNQHPGITSVGNALISAANPIAGVLSSLGTSALQNNYGAGLGALGGFLGGPGGKAAGTVIGDVVGGRTAQQTLADAINQGLGYGLNASGLGLGSQGMALGGVPGGMLGGFAQGALTNQAANALSSAMVNSQDPGSMDGGSNSGYSGDYSGGYSPSSYSPGSEGAATITTPLLQSEQVASSQQSPSAGLDSVMPTGKTGEVQPVWNESSLRLMDALNL